MIPSQRHRGSIASFIITGPGWTAIVYPGRTRHLNELPGEITTEIGFGIAGLHRIPPAPGRSCEIRACHCFGNLRFFRLAGSGVAEIDMNGNVPERVTGTGMDPPRSPSGEIPVPPHDGEEVPGRIPDGERYPRGVLRGDEPNGAL